MNDSAASQREAVARLAVALDLPPELAPRPDGLTREEAAWAELAAETQRTVDMVCAQLTEDYLHPALRAAGVPHPDQYHLTLGEPTQ